ncbi:hypothetical protein DAEQUDRAFT_251529 [Daedalea quercina L-15889]|uniref:Uncharacterized protein n=1 Tax=Daedalea quercina L-15889 TaxID=1314783 RepID=A0A165QNY5_9APHY|nr:hypothetical protein DAEQUDRAFT_251529 [Daedalea quercina L-15889]
MKPSQHPGSSIPITDPHNATLTRPPLAHRAIVSPRVRTRRTAPSQAGIMSLCKGRTWTNADCEVALTAAASIQLPVGCELVVRWRGQRGIASGAIRSSEQFRTTTSSAARVQHVEASYSAKRTNVHGARQAGQHFKDPAKYTAAILNIVAGSRLLSSPHHARNGLQMLQAGPDVRSKCSQPITLAPMYSHDHQDSRSRTYSRDGHGIRPPSSDVAHMTGRLPTTC